LDGHRENLAQIFFEELLNIHGPSAKNLLMKIKTSIAELKEKIRQLKADTPFQI
jgi:hypothetical protein